MKLTNEEKRVIEVMDNAFTFREVFNRAGIQQDRLAEVLKSLINKGILVETKADKVLQVEDDKQIAIIEVYDK